MNPASFVNILIDQWEAMRLIFEHAPIAVVLLAFIAAGIAFWLIGLLKRQQIANMDSESKAMKATLDLRSEQWKIAEADATGLREKLKELMPKVDPVETSIAKGSEEVKQAARSIAGNNEVVIPFDPRQPPDSALLNSTGLSGSKAAANTHLVNIGGADVRQLDGHRFALSGTASSNAAVASMVGQELVLMEDLSPILTGRTDSTRARTIPWDKRPDPKAPGT